MAVEEARSVAVGLTPLPHSHHVYPARPLQRPTSRLQQGPRTRGQHVPPALNCSLRPWPAIAIAILIRIVRAQSCCTLADLPSSPAVPHSRQPSLGQYPPTRRRRRRTVHDYTCGAASLDAAQHPPRRLHWIIAPLNRRHVVRTSRRRSCTAAHRGPRLTETVSSLPRRDIPLGARTAPASEALCP